MATAIPGVAFDDDANRTAFHSGLAGRATQPRRLATPSGIHRARRNTTRNRLQIRHVSMGRCRLVKPASGCGAVATMTPSCQAIG